MDSESICSGNVLVNPHRLTTLPLGIESPPSYCEWYILIVRGKAVVVGIFFHLHIYACA